MTKREPERRATMDPAVCWGGPFDGEFQICGWRQFKVYMPTLTEAGIRRVLMGHYVLEAHEGRERYRWTAAE